MKNRTAIKTATPSILLIVVLALTSRPAIAQTKIQGVIDGRSGPTMSLKTVNSPPDTTVLLTDTTDVGEVEGVFHGRTKQMPMTALIPGLPVQVSGTSPKALAWAWRANCPPAPSGEEKVTAGSPIVRLRWSVSASRRHASSTDMGYSRSRSK